MPVSRAETMEQRVAGVRRNMLRAGAGVSAVGLLALLLSALGLYAVVALGVTQRTREIGIRTAFGARRRQVVQLFFMNGFVLSLMGLAIGLPLSVAAARMIAVRMSWPVSSSALLGAAIAAIVLVVAAIASWLPARRASTIDPIAALRTE